MPKAFNMQLTINPFEIPNYSSKLYGSRRILGGHIINHNTDFDFYFHVSELETMGASLFELKRLKVLSKADKYTTSNPKYGKVFIIYKLPIIVKNKINADILIFTDKRDVAIMDKVLNILERSNAHQLLRDKQLRISVYNYMLQLEGFTVNDKKSACMDINTKQIYDLIIASYRKTSIIKHNLDFF